MELRFVVEDEALRKRPEILLRSVDDELAGVPPREGIVTAARAEGQVEDGAAKWAGMRLAVLVESPALLREPEPVQVLGAGTEGQRLRLLDEDRALRAGPPIDLIGANDERQGALPAEREGIRGSRISRLPPCRPSTRSNSVLLPEGYRRARSISSRY